MKLNMDGGMSPQNPSPDIVLLSGTPLRDNNYFVEDQMEMKASISESPDSNLTWAPQCPADQPCM